MGGLCRIEETSRALSAGTNRDFSTNPAIIHSLSRESCEYSTVSATTVSPAVCINDFLNKTGMGGQRYQVCHERTV